MITEAFPKAPAVHRSISDGLAFALVTRLWKNMAADGTAVSERKTKLMTTPSQRSISSNGLFAVPILTNPTTIDDDSMTIIVSTHNLAVVIALMESKDAQRDASLAANRIFQLSWVPWKMARVWSWRSHEEHLLSLSPGCRAPGSFRGGAHAAMCTALSNSCTSTQSRRCPMSRRRTSAPTGPAPSS